MAMRALPLRTAVALASSARPAVRAALPAPGRNASSQALAEIEDASSLQTPPPPAELAQDFDPVARSRLRRRGNRQLPPSRYRVPAA